MRTYSTPTPGDGEDDGGGTGFGTSGNGAAPAAIQARMASISSGRSRGWSLGGMTDSSSAVMTWNSSESSGLPGTTCSLAIRRSRSRILTFPLTLRPP